MAVRRAPAGERSLDAAGIRDPRLRADFQACRRLHAEHGRTYYLATALLPPAKRPYVWALYGFARYADEFVDSLTRPDPDALLTWVKSHVPSEVQTVELVRTSFQKVLLDRVKADGGWYDEETGEIVPVPGVTVTPGTPRPSLVVKPAEGAAEVIREAWRTGALTVTDLTALPGGDAA
jgi:hypothetical protein